MSVPRSVLVLGTAGGVGATTAAAMIVAGLAGSTGRMPSLSDRTGGRLAGRTPAKLASLPCEAGIGIYDLGHHVTDGALAELLISRSLLVVTTAASTAAEKRGADRAKDALHLVKGVVGIPRPLIVATQVFSRTTKQPAARNTPFAVHAIPWDRALAAGGQIHLESLDPSTSGAFESLVPAVKRALDLASPIVTLP